MFSCNLIQVCNYLGINLWVLKTAVFKAWPGGVAVIPAICEAEMGRLQGQSLSGPHRELKASLDNLGDSASK